MSSVYYSSGNCVLYHGDVLEILPQLPEASVQTVVTSPPYWGLRDYGSGEWLGGNEDCDHERKLARNDGGRTNTNGFHGSSRDDSDKGAIQHIGSCPMCGAKRIDKQLGLEPTPEKYCANMVAVFREVWRVLKPTGTVWMNLGDSYVANPISANGANEIRSDVETGGLQKGHSRRVTYRGGTLKPKDLVGIPWRVAFALQADGWYLRSDIIWSKPNPMPESVTDRPTKAHEYVFLLTKSPRYYYDADAIRENVVGRNKRTVWEITTQPYPEAHFATYPEKLVQPCILAGTSEKGVVLDPFCGAGTTGVVAKKLGRHFIGIDIKADYLDMTQKRIDMIPVAMELFAVE